MYLWGVSPYQGPPGPPDIDSLKKDGNLAELLDKPLSLQTIGGASLSALEGLEDAVAGKAEASDVATALDEKLNRADPLSECGDDGTEEVARNNIQALGYNLDYVNASAALDNLGLPTDTSTILVKGGNLAGINAIDDARYNVLAAPLPRVSTRSGNYILLNGMPQAAGGFTAVTLIKDKWVYAPYEYDTARSFDQLGLLTSSAASNGTAVAIFALFQSHSITGEPSTLQTSYASYGSINLTAAAGPLTLATVGLTIPKGKWWLGVAWSGTATGSPSLYCVTGSHLSCSGSSFGSSSAASNFTGRFQSVSGASPPATASASIGAQASVAIWGRNP